MAAQKRVDGFSDGTVAIFDDGAGGGGLHDLDAPRNAAAADPGNHLEHVWWHSRVQPYQRHLGPTDVPLTLPAVSGKTRTFTGPLMSVTIRGQIIRTDFDLLTHGLPYIPPFQVLIGNRVLTHGYKLQEVDTSGNIRHRIGTLYATSSKIGLATWGASTDLDLPSMSVTMTVVVYRYPEPDSDVIFSRDVSTGRVVMDKGRFDTAQQVLRSALPAESPFDAFIEPSIDVANGRWRRGLADGSIEDEAGYNGSFVPGAVFHGVIS